MNKYQHLALKKFSNGYNLFITGGAGTGKSFIINQFKKQHTDITITSTTGLSALHINGQTIHSWSGLTPDVDLTNVDLFVRNLQNNYSKLNNYLFTKILIIDEISMLDGDTLDFLNKVSQQIRNNNQPFGGIQLVLVGDFYQLPPVNSDTFAFQSTIWEELIDYTIILKDIYRQEDSELTYILNKVRIGSINTDISNKLLKCQTIHPDKIYTHLYPNKKDVFVKNVVELDRLSGEKIELTATIVYKKNKVPFDFPKNIEQSIPLKKNAFIMLTKNIDFENGLVNGTQAVFITLDGDKMVIETMNKCIHRISKHIYEYEHYSIQQFPICLAWAITIHKSQGMGIEYLSIDIGDNIFEAGQAYVALSRSKTLHGLHIKKFSKKSIICNSNVKQFYKNLSKKSSEWYRLDDNVYRNRLNGMYRKTISNTARIIDKVEETKKEYSELTNCKYTNYSTSCKYCDYMGCRNDYIVWYKENICCQCIIDKDKYRQVNRTDIHKMFPIYSKHFIDTKLKTIPFKHQRSNNRFRTKTKIYLLKHTNELFGAVGAWNKRGVNLKMETIKTSPIITNTTFKPLKKQDRIDLCYKYILEDISVKDIACKMDLSKTTIENYILDIIKSGKYISKHKWTEFGITCFNIKLVVDIILEWKKVNKEDTYEYPALKYIKDRLDKNVSYLVIKYVLWNKSDLTTKI